MAFKTITSILQFDFQINRVLSYGHLACDEAEVLEAAKNIRDFESWFLVWEKLGAKAESEERFLHAAYYYRLAEFFLVDTNPEKQKMYEKSIKNFSTVMSGDPSLVHYSVPYKTATLKTHIYKNHNAHQTIVMFGGYDSFIEEFYLSIKEIAQRGYTVYVFEGPGQGQTLRQAVHFESDWEKPLSAVLDFFNLQAVTVIGISWGGYLALRAAAFEKRISRVVAYDVLYDGFDCMTRPFPVPVRIFIKALFALNQKSPINKLLKKAMQKKLIVDWAISHGQYITGTPTPYDFYKHLMKHSLMGIEHLISCDVLLLAGEKDHYIPRRHYYILMKKLKNARSLTGRVFTEKEGGEQHCQVGNYQLAIDYIINWLGRFDNNNQQT